MAARKAEHEDNGENKRHNKRPNKKPPPQRNARMAARKAEHKDKHHDKRPDKERGPRATGRTQNAGASREGRGEKRGGAVWCGAHSAAHHNGTERGGSTTTTNTPNKRPNNGVGSGFEGRGAAGRTKRHTPRRNATQGTDHAGGAPAPTGKGRGAAANKRRRGAPAGRKKGAA
jgi:hypothetical protein